MSGKASKTGYELYASYDLTKNFGVKAGYADLGKFSEFGVIYESRAIYVTGKATYPLNDQASIFAKVGVSANRAKVSYMGYSETENNASAIVGVGAAYSVTPNIAVVAEYENFGKIVDKNGGNIKADVWSVGLRYKF